MRFTTVSSPHLPPVTSTSTVMRRVLYALLPAAVASIWYFGWGVLINILIAVTVALIAEAGVLAARGRPVMPVLADNTAVVTAVLLALAIPPLAPWWLPAIGTAFAIVIAKQLYGGLGYNTFNPAMVGYVVLIISFPVEMTTWVLPRQLADQSLDILQTLQFVFTGQLPSAIGLDTLTSATPLDKVKTQLGLNYTIAEIRTNPLFGDFGGKGWEWLGNWYFLGGIWLLYKRVITWHIPVAVLGSLFVIALLFNLVNADAYPSPLFHVFSGGAMVGAFFIATDPITASTTPRGRLVYGAGIGLLVYVIRTWGGYPDGVAFAVLLMNVAVPTIDYYTQPRVFGQPK
jgi:electron transport complex protein RnfD